MVTKGRNLNNHKVMKDLLLYLWQLPQNLLGLILCYIYKAESILEYKGKLIRVNKSFPSGISLGNYIILQYYPFSKTGWDDVRHEYGHTIQSLYLGWLYLIIIGLPSLLGNIYDRLAHKKWEWKDRNSWYYNQPWEKWADKLGGVNR